MSSLPRSTVFYGAVINPQTLTDYQALPNCLLSVGPDGAIDWLEDDVQDSMIQDVLAQKGSADADVIALKHGEFIMPGFVDTHTHAPQVPNLGRGQEYELLDWLNEVTFPMEARFSDVEFARRTYESVVRRTINSGTTTCCYYGTLHLEATKILADIVHAHGQRAFVGKCNMDRDSRDNYIEPSVDASLTATHALITHIRSLPHTPAPALVEPILTPRFAISCTDALLASLGALARADSTLRIQTHISENAAEIAYTRKLFPDRASYADVYDHYGLLGPRTVLAHAIHLEPSEVALVRERRAGVSHCPTSNFNLRSGVCRVGMLLDNGIKVGLGTDMSGGYAPSILTAIQHASIASKVVAMQTPAAQSDGAPPPFAGKQLPIATLLHLATLGGAQVCDLAARVGSFAPGKAFDALLVSMRDEAGNPAVWGVESAGESDRSEAGLRDMLERFFFNGDDRNLRRVYVQGRWVGGAETRK